jgi:hypothetical protein
MLPTDLSPAAGGDTARQHGQRVNRPSVAYPDQAAETEADVPDDRWAGGTAFG